MNNRSQTSTSRNPPGRIPELDGWRAIAAISIVIGHFLGFQHLRAVEHIPGLYPIVRFAGTLGLQALFMISGFVICRLLLIEEQRYGSFSFKGFYIRRFVRVLPPFYIYLATLAVLTHFGMVALFRKDFVKAALLLVDINSGSAPWLTGHAWTLSVEEQFYLFFPTILWLTAPRLRRSVFGAICALFIGTTIALACTGRTLPFSCGVMGGFVGIFYGVLLSLHEDKLRSIAKRIPGILVLLAAVILLLVSVSNLSRWQWALYQTMALSPAIALFMMFSLDRKSWFQSLLCWRPLRAIGIISYTVYLWQQLFTARSESFRGAGHLIPYFFPTLFLIAPLSWILMEKRLIKLGKTLSRGVRAPHSAHPGPAYSPIVAPEPQTVPTLAQ